MFINVTFFLQISKNQRSLTTAHTKYNNTNKLENKFVINFCLTIPFNKKEIIFIAEKANLNFIFYFLFHLSFNLHNYDMQPKNKCIVDEKKKTLKRTTRRSTAAQTKNHITKL